MHLHATHSVSGIALVPCYSVLLCKRCQGHGLALRCPHNLSSIMSCDEVGSSEVLKICEVIKRILTRSIPYWLSSPYGFCIPHPLMGHATICPTCEQCDSNLGGRLHSQKIKYSTIHHTAPKRFFVFEDYIPFREKHQHAFVLCIAFR